MIYRDKYTGKAIDKPSDRLPRESKSKCDRHTEVYIICNCLRCGAPNCCPACCEEAEKEYGNET